MADIIYVDEKDNAIGSGSINEAIEKGIVHRIAEVFLVNSKGELLIQKRALHVIGSPGRWNASSAGHVDIGESYLETAIRETKEEIGIDGVLLNEFGKTYTEEAIGKRKKKKFSMLFKGKYDGEIKFDPEEVADVMWIKPADLKLWVEKKPEDFTEIFVQSFKEFFKKQMS